MTVKDSCHCGAKQFIVTNLSETRCICSFCSMRGALRAYQDREEDFVLTTSRDRVSSYQWGARIRSSTITARFAGVTPGLVRPFGIARRTSQCQESSGCRSMPGCSRISIQMPQPIEVLNGKAW